MPKSLIDLLDTTSEEFTDEEIEMKPKDYGTHDEDEE